LTKTEKCKLRKIERDVLWKAQADKAAQDELLRTVPKYQTMASTANDPAQTGPAPEGVMAIERAARLASEHANAQLRQRNVELQRRAAISERVASVVDAHPMSGHLIIAASGVGLVAPIELSCPTVLSRWAQWVEEQVGTRRKTASLLDREWTGPCCARRSFSLRLAERSLFEKAAPAPPRRRSATRSRFHALWCMVRAAASDMAPQPHSSRRLATAMLTITPKLQSSVSE
jgi:hypothetical protein